MTEKLIPIADLSKILLIDRSNVRRYVLKKGFNFHRIRTDESRSQLTLALTTEDAKKVIQLRRIEGFKTK